MSVTENKSNTRLEASKRRNRSRRGGKERKRETD